MSAKLLLSDKVVFEDGAIREIVIWLDPGSVPPSRHSFKYRLVYVVDGIRVIGFDNERGKGDHLHLHGVERPYEFTGVEKLLADFHRLVRTERGK